MEQTQQPTFEILKKPTPKQQQKHEKNLSELKRLIHYKFKSVLKFAKLANINVNLVRNLLADKLSYQTSEKLIPQIVKAVMDIDAPNDDGLLDFKTKVYIRGKIFQRYPTLTAFCKAYPEYKLIWMSQMLGGRKKKKDARILRLLQIINGWEAMKQE